MDDKIKIEKEIRFYFSTKKLAFLESKLKYFNFFGSCHEVTKMYNNPNPMYDFYNPSIDGRLRLRYGVFFKDKTRGVGLISWKQRILKHRNDLVRKEREVEFSFSMKDIDNVRVIIEEVLKCPFVSSYERRRHYYAANNFSITLDEFPFGLMLEFESKKNKIANREINSLLKKFNLKIANASLLSCDDMYKDLCRKNNKRIKPNILFNDKDMPHL